eukprot:6551352-Prorocentrum_lima.AAC.1
MEEHGWKACRLPAHTTVMWGRLVMAHFGLREERSHSPTGGSGGEQLHWAGPQVRCRAAPQAPG